MVSLKSLSLYNNTIFFICFIINLYQVLIEKSNLKLIKTRSTRKIENNLQEKS